MGLLTAKPSSAKIEEEDPWFLDIDERPDWQTQFGNRQPLKLEIGFGTGDFLIEMAAREPHSNFIGMDFYHKGIRKLMARIRSLQLNNIRVVHGDVRTKIPLLFNDGGMFAPSQIADLRAEMLATSTCPARMRHVIQRPGKRFRKSLLW